ncbi:MAG: hypothetical protein JWN37_722 [Candidatus Nomurabacteria bacterium]|nr:hypothetical protein [Candidatus Nomurabacteria bacterium]
MEENLLKIEKWRKTHKQLLGFIETDNTLTGDQIRNWIAQCIVYFTDIKMSQNIIDYFLSKLEYRKERGDKKRFYMEISGHGIDEEEKYEYDTGIGPFSWSTYSGGYLVTDSNRLTQKQVDRTRMTPILVAFQVAENIINNYEESERIIPKVLLNQFNTEETQSIYIGLENIQNSYEKRNIKDILASAVTTTELICSLIAEISAIKNIGAKIKRIYETESIYKKYNMNQEVVWALNNSRIIRNYDIHKPEKINYTTLYEAVSYVHILVLFINSILVSGEIKLKENK